MAKKQTTEEKVEKTSPKADKAVEAKSVPEAKSSKKKVDIGVLHVQSTYNNTMVLLTDVSGNALASSSAGALGFKGAKKGTPFAAAKVGETLAIKAQPFGIKEVSVIVKGTGSGRESAIRSFISKGINLSSIKDATPVPHNGPRPPRPRRV
jgi:small subunit ribosomal protein S11